MFLIFIYEVDLFASVADPVLFGALDPGFGIRDGRKTGSGIRDEHSRLFFESFETGFSVKNT